MKIRRRKKYSFPIIYYTMCIIHAQPLQYLFHRSMGSMMIDIDKIKMVFHHKIAPVKHGMVMMPILNSNPFILFQFFIGFLLPPKKPDVYIPTGPMFRFWPVEAASIPLQHHHLIAMSIVPTRQLRYSTAA